VAAPDDPGSRAQVGNPGVGATADKDHIDLLAKQRLARPEIHVGQRLLQRLSLAEIGDSHGIGHTPGHRNAHAGIGAVGDHRLQTTGVDGQAGIIGSAVIGCQPAPFGHGCVPGCPLRRIRTAVQVLERGVVRGDHAGPRAALDGHVADSHAGFHAKAADGRAGVLEHVAGAAVHTDTGDDRQDDVLGGDAGL